MSGASGSDAYSAAREPLPTQPTEPDPRLVCYFDHGEPGDVATFIFCGACVALIVFSVGWIVWMVARAV